MKAALNEDESKMKSAVLKLDPRDNVMVALQNLRQGERINFPDQTYVLVTDVHAKHKFATEDLVVGSSLIMYGVLVGKARQPIRMGDALTTLNTVHEAAPYHGKSAHNKSGKFEWSPPNVDRWRRRTFLGYHRPDGQVGTRNYWLVVPLVFCENRNIDVLKQAFEEELGLAPPKIYRQQVAKLVRLYREGTIRDIEISAEEKNPQLPEQLTPLPDSRNKVFKNIDGVKFLMHEGGCGGTREDSNNLCGLLAGYIHHPNVAGATVLSLGCQNAQPSILMDALRERDPGLRKPVLMYEQQQSGTESAMLSDAIRATFEGLVEANRLARKPALLNKLTVALKCGGSDGFSGISANPAIGYVSDLLAALGAKSILSEFPELCGMEQSLINRCVDASRSDRFIQLMRDYAARAKAVHSGFEMNPSPGNIKDGLITDAMKSAGAARKGGTSPVCEVLDYPEYDNTPGLALLCTPGNDVECVTAQVGAGANVVVFTTGLGTPTGNPVAPVIKVSTNTSLAERMSDIIDIDTGAVIRGETTIEKVGESMLDLIVNVASGKVRTKAEQLDQNDFIPWKRGVSL